MHIQINGLDEEHFHRPLQLIANLFFETPTLSFEETNEQKEIWIDFDVHIDGKVTVEAVLNDGKDNCFSSKYENKLKINGSEKEHIKIINNTVSHVFLLLLQRWTGIVQQWGILTGVRPVKLFHNLLQDHGKDSVHEILKNDYLVSEGKIQLMEEIVERQLSVIPDLHQLQNEVSIYIGIPFCPTKCAYCTFPAYAINGRQGSVASFLDGLHYEMKRVGEWLSANGINITAIYFGGGTPTSITADEMDRLYEEMYTSFPNISAVREITVEAGRPDTITPEKIEVLKKWNIDRISINPQSFIQRTLKTIGRHHTVGETIEKFHLARQMGMDNINMDLIIGLPGEGVREFHQTLEEIEKLMPESLTIHTLSFKRASEMTKHKQDYEVADRNEVERMMDLAQSWTRTFQYRPYYLYRQKNILGNLENVGYSKPNHESFYNILIMEEKQTIIGLGCGAASKFIHPKTGKISRFANPKEPKLYNETFKMYTEKKMNLLAELFDGKAINH